MIAAGSIGEARVYKAADGTRVASITAVGPAVFAVAFGADGKRLAAAGYDRMVRVFDVEYGKLVKEFSAVPLGESATDGHR